MRRLRVRRLARTEIDAAFDWYLQRSPRVAQRFLESWKLPSGQSRRFPYAVYYKVYPKAISVVGVIHCHRHPAVWLRRG